MVEFSLIAFPLMTLALAIFEAAFVFYVAHDMQRVVNEFVIDVRSGKVQLTTLSSESIKRDRFCAKLTFSSICNNIQLTLRPQPDCDTSEYCWYSLFGSNERWTSVARLAPNLDAGDTFSAGAKWQPMLLSLVYPLPTITTVWSSAGAVSRNGALVRAIIANATWVNDPYAQAGIP